MPNKIPRTETGAASPHPSVPTQCIPYGGINEWALYNSADPGNPIAEWWNGIGYKNGWECVVPGTITVPVNAAPGTYSGYISVDTYSSCEGEPPEADHVLYYNFQFEVPCVEVDDLTSQRIDVPPT